MWINYLVKDLDHLSSREGFYSKKPSFSQVRGLYFPGKPESSKITNFQTTHQMRGKIGTGAIIRTKRKTRERYFFIAAIQVYKKISLVALEHRSIHLKKLLKNFWTSVTG